MSCCCVPCCVQVGIGTLLWGPASDKFGRRSMYMAGMVVFLGTTLGCLFAPTIGVLVAMRGLQGLGGKGEERSG
jgi:DHA1 family bicyclomycin/chloramphenicol resistance-like MFS transporter